MDPLTLAEIASAVRAGYSGSADVSVTSVSTDTRHDCVGSVFFALRGDRADGHAYVLRAAEAGAVASVVERAVAECPIPQLVVPDALKALGDLARFYIGRFDIPKLAVTGSVGKTSVRSMTAAVLGARMVVHESERNHNNEIGVPLTLLGVGSRHGAVVAEMAMRGTGQIAYLAKIMRPLVGIITKVGLSHIELLGSQESIAEAKAELLLELPEDGFAILPADDPFLPFLMRQSRCPTLTFGRHPDADFRCEDCAITAEGQTRFRVNRVGFEVGAPGLHQAVNAAAACAAGSVLGISLEEAAARLRAWRSPEMRMAVLHGPNGITVLDDTYNAAPDSTQAALKTLTSMAALEGRRAVAVLGDMKELGPHAAEAHASIGRLEEMARVGLLVTVGSDAALIGSTARVDRMAAHSDAAEAGEAIVGLLRERDIVLVKGSRAMGMEKVTDAIMRFGSGWGESQAGHGEPCPEKD